MGQDGEKRPLFYEGQYLGSADLQTMVEYQRNLQSRHLLGAHTWGIAMGLEVTEKTMPGAGVEIYIQPGYAWDGFGRPVVVLAPYKIPADLFLDYSFDPALDAGISPGRLIQVWLRYDEVTTQGQRMGFEVCDTPDQNSRVQETFRVETGPRTAHLDRHEPVSIAGYTIDAQDALQALNAQASPVALFDESIPYQDNLPRDSKARWLIPLGKVRWLPASDPNLTGNFVQREAADLASSQKVRRYVGVVAGAVQAADKHIRLRGRTKEYSIYSSDDLVWVEGTMRVEGDVRLFGTALDFRDIKGLDASIPLKVQRRDRSGDGADLQLVIGRDDQGANRLSIGPLEKDPSVTSPQLVPRVTIQDDGAVGIGAADLTKGHLQIETNQNKPAIYLAGNQEGWGSGIVFKNTSALGKEYGIYAGNGGNLHVSDNLEQKDRILVTKQGHIGIGSIDPSRPLTIRAQGTGEELISFEDPGGATKWHINQNLAGNNPGLNFVETDVADGRLFLKAGGDVGIGTTSPTAKLTLKGSLPEHGLLSFFSPTADIQYDGGSDGLFLIQSTGGKTAFTGSNIGIGTTTPREKLEVSGNIRLGQTGEYFAMGALQNLRVVAGRVKSNGEAITPNLGFTAKRSGRGNYEIQFNANIFGISPIVVASSADSLRNDRVATITGITTTACTIVMRQVIPSNDPDVGDEGYYEDTEFTFIALGTP